MTASTKPLTGRKVLAIALGAFGVIITANMALVYAAVGSFPGLDVKNTYVASQVFDKDRARQVALGWKVSASYKNSAVHLSLQDDKGEALRPVEMRTSIGRATHANADLALSFIASGDGFTAPANLAPGKWQLRLHAVDEAGATFRQRIALWVKE